MPELRYVVLHNHPEGLIMSQQQRDLLFATGTVIDVQECCLHSLQPEFLKRITRRPLTVLLWGMADRYGVAEKECVEVFTVECWADAHNYCKGLRPHAETWTDDEGKEHPFTHWRNLEPGKEPDAP